MKERRKWGLFPRLIAFLLALTLFVGLTWYAAWALMPRRTNYGSLWEQYLQEPEDSMDVLFLGSSIVYCDIAPAWVWEASGLRSWVLAGPEQTIPLTYYYLRQAVKTQSPRLVALELNGLLFREYQDFSKANVSTMPFSLNRFLAALNAVEPEERKGLLFPLYNYHYRWTELKEGELEKRLQPVTDPLAGYTLLDRTTPMKNYWVNPERVLDPKAYEKNLRYLGKIGSFCRKWNIRLLLYIAPSAAQIDPELRERLMGDVRAMGLEAVDMTGRMAEMEIDDGQDWYDGLHFNLYGAEKFSKWLGEYLAEQVTPDPGADREAWQTRLDYLQEQAAKRTEGEKG